MSIWRVKPGAALTRAGVLAAILAGMLGGTLAAAPAASQEVTASQLGDIDPLIIGARSPANGGLPDTLWRGSDPLGLADAASRAPGESGFLAASEVAARVLMSAGPSPQGMGSPRDASRARLGALLDLGRLDAVDSIVSQTPRGLEDPDFAALAVSARLALGEVGPACRVGENLPTGRDGSFWLRLRAACFAWAGETAAADLTLSLARDAGADMVDDAFASWVQAGGAGRAPSRINPPRDPLEAALAFSAGYAFSEASLEAVSLPAAAGLARRDDVAPDLRARAALRAARAGALDVEGLAAAYDALPLPGDPAPAQRLSAGQAANRPLADALLYEAAMAEDAGPFVAAAAIDGALARAASPAEFIVIARALAEPLEALPSSTDFLDAAPRFALAAAALGDRRLGDRWLNPGGDDFGPPAGFDAGPAFDALGGFYGGQPDYSNSPLEPGVRLAAQAVVVAADPRATPASLASVAQQRLDAVADGGEAEQAGARRDALILLALGAESRPALRRAAAAAVAEGPLGNDGAAQALTAARLAADAGAMGEAALYAAEALASAGASHAPTAAEAIEVLRAVGLNEDARAVAVETLLAARLGAGDGTN